MTSSPDKREHLYKILVIGELVWLKTFCKLYPWMFSGELGTGKTSFIKRYVHQFFSQNYRATIGVDFALKVLNWDQSTIIRLQLWDIAGQERWVRRLSRQLWIDFIDFFIHRFGNMTRVYYKEAVGAFIVWVLIDLKPFEHKFNEILCFSFDVTRSATFDAVLKWKQDLDSKVSLPDGSQIPCILLANKVKRCDLLSSDSFVNVSY